MKIRYTFDESYNQYFASGYDNVAIISATADSLAELQEEVKLQIELCYEDKAQEYNAIQETAGSFTRFSNPQATFVKESSEEFWGDFPEDWDDTATIDEDTDRKTKKLAKKNDLHFDREGKGSHSIYKCAHSGKTISFSARGDTGAMRSKAAEIKAHREGIKKPFHN